MVDFVKRRTMMVDTQVRPSDVTKFPIIDAMLSVEREAFVPDALREAAYVGENLTIAPGRVMLDARTLAKMLDALDLQPTDLVLDIGAGLGYSSAVVARMAEAVVALEDDEAMTAEAQRRLSEQGVDNVAVVTGPLVEGAPKHAPYDVILVQGAWRRCPRRSSRNCATAGASRACSWRALWASCVWGSSRARIAWRLPSMPPH